MAFVDGGLVTIWCRDAVLARGFRTPEILQTAFLLLRLSCKMHGGICWNLDSRYIVLCKVFMGNG